jgi:hypothetical protein
VVDLAGLAPVYGVVENVGGALLAQAYALLEPDGSLQSVGQASLEPSCIDFERARQRGGGRIKAFNVFSHGGAFGGDLAALLGARRARSAGELARAVDAAHRGARCLSRPPRSGQGGARHRRRRPAAERLILG